MTMRSLAFLLIAGLALVMMAGEADAETSDDFNEVNLYFYGDLDNGDGNISTRMPTSDTDTQSDCPQEGNRLSWPGQDRQWQDVGTWEIEMQTAGEVASGDYTFTIWANSTQGTVEDVQFRITIYIGDSGGVTETSQSKTITDSSEYATRFDINFDIENESFNYDDKIEIWLEYSGGDPGENPTTGGNSTEQIVVLTSSTEHPAGIGDFSINHYQIDFNQITVDAPDFTLTDTDGSTFNLSDYENNKTLIMLFMFSTDEPSQKFVKDALEPYSEKMDNNSVAIISISVFGNDDEQELKNYAEEYNWRHALSDSEGDIEIAYNVIGTPKIFIIDNNGKITYSHLGAVSQNKLEEEVYNATVKYSVNFPDDIVHIDVRPGASGVGCTEMVISNLGTITIDVDVSLSGDNITISPGAVSVTLAPEGNITTPICALALTRSEAIAHPVSVLASGRETNTHLNQVQVTSNFTAIVDPYARLSIQAPLPAKHCIGSTFWTNFTGVNNGNANDIVVFEVSNIQELEDAGFTFTLPILQYQLEPASFQNLVIKVDGENVAEGYYNMIVTIATTMDGEVFSAAATYQIWMANCQEQDASIEDDSLPSISLIPALIAIGIIALRRRY